MDEVKNQDQKNIIAKLMSGDYRLVDVFWAGYVVVGAILTSIGTKQQTVESALAVVILMSIYYFVISIAVWSSATQYKGKRVWTILAKIMAVIGILSSVINLGVLGYKFLL
ncbi:hypothetical protein BFX12_14200 [Vibrio cholerae]|uniref:hypothetical protein n=1 Tax=Vibrio cholerae TaxID=666 RepID=UPI0001564296|nr:hypothetical protein [Vibrio cholerae]KNA47623.1 hypothetical protein A5A_023682 [Vibrio cholerae MZO-2]OEC25629.1 hypothetical protein BFX12_14200 [Vibrio cholerae]